ncbi:MAG TPA: ABC transporter substrate-binding protein, partial [Gemmatimonadaceae bacterium]|nr:ABC transporter substrate-binding protein [Gemmatimonadaceae bacterium]
MRSAHPAFLLATFGLLGCADRSSDPDAGEVGGTVVITVPGGFTPSLPPIIQEAMSRSVADQVFERLADIGEDLNTLGDRGFTPRLARSWSWAPDSLSIAFALDPRARWHDGRPVRASDVRFTLGLLKDPLTSSPTRPLIANIDSITVADSLTAVVWFRQRTPEQFYDAAYQIEVLPEHVLGQVPRNQLRAANVASVFVGSGP